MNSYSASNGITLEKKPSKKRIYTFFVMLVAFASALLLWFYVLGYDSPYYKKEFDVPVVVEGVSSLRESMGYTVISDFGFSIKVTVSGTQNEVNKLRSSDIKAFVDVSGVTVPGNNTLPVNVTVSNENEITVEAKSVDSAVIFIDKNIVAEIPVKIDITDYTLESGYSVGDFITSPVTVTVEGPESELSKIAYAYGVVQPGALTHSTKFNTSVALYDNGNNRVTNSFISLKDTSVTVNLPVYKTVNLPVKVYFVSGYFSTESAAITLSDNYITVKGLVEDFEGLTEIKINVAENTLTSDTVVKQLVLPTGIECVSGQKSIIATITFNEIVMRAVAASCSAVCDIINAPTDKDITVVTANLNVKFMGPVEGLLNLSQSSFRAVIDLSNIILESGKTYYVPADIRLNKGDDGLLNGIYPSGEYAVTISVNDREE
ncbi:MAG: CdaR family protein [Eubacteriales bacterium]|nr:CdaR family protein [Eubacteriales bacterium]